MRLFRLVRQGMRGRKGDTRLLRGVLTLSFLFITLASVVLASIDLSRVQMRVQRHGRFQAAAFGVVEQDREALAGIAEETAASLVLGETQTLGLMGTLDKDFAAMGSLELVEGRLPAGPRDILLTRSALERLPGAVRVGDQIRVVLELTHVGDRAWMDYATVVGAREGFWADFETRLTAEDLAWFEAWYQEVGYGDWFGPMEDWDRETYLKLLQQFATLRQHNLLFVKDLGANRREPFHAEDITLSLHYKSVAYELAGQRWGARQGERMDDGGVYERLLVIREYEIVGLAASYTDQWAAGENPLPEAFVSPEGGRELVAAVKKVEAAHPDMPVYQPGSLVLLYEGGLSAREMFDRALLLRGDGRQPGYRIDEYSQGSQGTSSTGRFTALEEGTGAERSLMFHVTSGLMEIYTDAGTYQAPAHLLTSGRLRLPGLLPLPLEALSPEEARSTPGLPLQMNRFTYPEEEDAGGALQRLMPALLSVLTLAAVLQIFLTQMRRRSRRLALMKALGMDQEQLAKMLLMEAALLLAFALPLGAALGLALSMGAVAGLNVIQGQGSVALHVPAWPVLRGLLLGAVALFAGVLLPLYQAMRIPMSGAFEQPAKAPPRLKAGRTPRRLQYRHMLVRNARANPGRSLLGLALGVLILLAPLMALFLGFHAFSDYRAEVVDKGRPDYVLSAPYGMNPRVVQEHLDSLGQEVDSLEAVLPWLRGQHVGLQVNRLVAGASPILSRLYQQPGEAFGPPPRGSALPGAQEQEQPLAPGEKPELPLLYFTTLWALDRDSPALSDLVAQLDAGGFDAEAFAKGEELLVIIPRYHAGDKGLVLSTRPQDAGHYLEDGGIAPGDELTFYTQKVEIVMDNKQSSLVVSKARVGGIIRDVALPFTWPLSDETGSHILVGSPRLLTKVYPQASSRMTAQQARWFRLSVATFYPYNYGMTFFFAKAGPGADRESGDVAMLNYARDKGLDLKNYRTANQALHTQAVNSAMLIALLGSAVFLIALVILASSLASGVRQERKRFGILQSMGLTRGRLMGGQALYGLMAGLVCTLAANLLLLGLVAVVTALGLPEGVGLVSELTHSTLRGYPFLAHGLICLVFVLVSALMHAWPLRSIARQTAISNILD